MPPKRGGGLGRRGAPERRGRRPRGGLQHHLHGRRAQRGRRLDAARPLGLADAGLDGLVHALPAGAVGLLPRPRGARGPSEGFQGDDLSILRIRDLVPRMFVFVLFLVV